MDSSDLTENFETGLFESKDGKRFVRCEFNPEEPVWIDVTGDRWGTVYAGKPHELDWGKVNLPPVLVSAIKPVVLGRMKDYSPVYLTALHTMLTNWSRAAMAEEVDLSQGLESISASAWLKVWERLKPHCRSIFRSVFQELAAKAYNGASYSVSKEMGRWKANPEQQSLRVVMEWNAESGSFTSAEWELIRRELVREDPYERDLDCATRIFGCILNETLKRPQQILAMKRNALWAAPSGREFFLRIPKAKVQADERPASWQITNELARAIHAYSERPEIHSLQQRFDRLVVMPAVRGEEIRWMTHGQVDVFTARVRLQRWVRRQGIISPRTERVINLTPYRIRHTGATAMAIQGVPRDQIQEVLEHDSPYSADAYIQAAGSDLMPALERATDRGVGEVFSELRDVYFFKGTVVDEVGRRPIHIPVVVENEVAQPAVAGSCGKDGACTLHPFWACYNGCPHFLAWRDAPHQKSLDYVESQLKRWGDAEGGKERSKLAKDFDRTGAGIREVMDQIEQSQTEGESS